MRPVIDILEERISAAMADVTGQDGLPALVKPATDAKFGDYQANGVMAAAKRLKTNPRELAGKVVVALELADMCETPEIAGPGFINLRLKPDFLADKLLEINADTAHLGVSKAESPETVVVDFSCPNIAKQMHVGHLRSTIIGDCICRMLEFQGHNVIRQNHIGDWGTQFGMLTYYLDDKRLGTAGASYLEIPDLEEFYRKAKHLFDISPEFADRSRQYVVKLQSGDKHVLFNWEVICKQSISHAQQLYDALHVTLTKDDIRGESFYNPVLQNVVDELKQKGIARESEGAICVFPEGFSNKEGEPMPFIIQKSDGAFLYATTDLAAIRYRIQKLKANKIIYVTDARQKLHFEMLFATARLAGWVNDDIELVHVTFGTVLGEDNKPLKTRSGENIKLRALLDEAVERALSVVEGKNPELTDEKKAEIAQAVGIGAVKYADYSNNRTSDYVFSFDKMLAMEGNTAPYMQYAYARVKSIERKAVKKDVNVESELTGITALDLTEPAELDLAKHLIRYGEAIEGAARECRPNYLTTHLYEIAQKFSSFYNSCPVLIAEEAKRPTRLLLCDLTARTIKHGLVELLGIRVVEQM